MTLPLVASRMTSLSIERRRTITLHRRSGRASLRWRHLRRSDDCDFASRACEAFELPVPPFKRHALVADFENDGFPPAGLFSVLGQHDVAKRKRVANGGDCLRFDGIWFFEDN